MTKKGTILSQLLHPRQHQKQPYYDKNKDNYYNVGNVGSSERTVAANSKTYIFIKKNGRPECHATATRAVYKLHYRRECARSSIIITHCRTVALT